MLGRKTVVLQNQPPMTFNCMGPQNGEPLCPCQMKIFKRNGYNLAKCPPLDDIWCEIKNKRRLRDFKLIK